MIAIFVLSLCCVPEHQSPCRGQGVLSTSCALALCLVLCLRGFGQGILPDTVVYTLGSCKAVTNGLNIKWINIDIIETLLCIHLYTFPLLS